MLSFLQISLGVAAIICIKSTEQFHFFSNSEDGQNQNAIGEECPELEDPPHGYYACKMTEEGNLCFLMCDEGFVVPITDKVNVPLEVRGVYLCERVSNGRRWHPHIFFDCTERKDVLSLVFHFALTSHSKPPCNRTQEVEEHSNISRDLTEKSGIVGLSKGKYKHWASAPRWEFDITCVSGVWQLDTRLYISYDLETVDRFEEVKKDIYEIFEEEDRLLFQTQGAQNPPEWPQEWDALTFDCPVGTRVEQDLTCRGCSKGYYMEEATSECLPCPAGTYQDEDFAVGCKRCPMKAERTHIAVTRYIDCFSPGSWRRRTGVGTVLAMLSAVLGTAIVVNFFRSKVRNEPTGIGPEYYEDDERIEDVGKSGKKEDQITLVPQYGSGDSYLSNGDAPSRVFSDLEEDIRVAKLRRAKFSTGSYEYDEDDDSIIDIGNQEQPRESTLVGILKHRISGITRKSNGSPQIRFTRESFVD